MSHSYAPPSGPHPDNAPVRSASLSTDLDGVPDEPPPAYSPAAGQGDTSVQTGPTHLALSRPPPSPSRVEQNITGVGVGYGRRTDPPAAQHTGQGWDGGMSPQRIGADPFLPLPPPNHAVRMADPAPSKGSSSSRPSSQHDFTPTEAPTPGRPLLHHGEMLVYPKGYFCSKCKSPAVPCSSADDDRWEYWDWRKFGKPYNSALAHSYTISTGPSSNPSTSSATNFQRPLPNFGSHSHSSAFSPPPGPNPRHNPYGHLPPPPGKGNHYSGNPAPPPPRPPPSTMPQQQNLFVQHTPGPVPPGSVVVMPGDPKIGGRLCWRCGGGGRETSFFGFDDGRCWECRGLGRLF